MRDLSVLIPARNEMFLRHTVEDVLSALRADTEIIAVLDGAWPAEPIPDDPRLTLIHHSESHGQRAATNEAARYSQARFVMKLDAHCRVAEGFDVELLRSAKELGSDVTQVPAMYNLHVFDWVCKGAKCGWRGYQGPTQQSCPKCGGAWADFVERELIWKPRKNRLTTAWRFDRDLHFQYWTDWQKTTEGRREISDTMSCLGACWFMSRDRFWRLGGLDERHGSWGQMGTEIACKSWLSGGRMVTNKRTWFSHLFRTQGGDFGFPYPLSGREIEQARSYSHDLWFPAGDAQRFGLWAGQSRPLQWLLDRFAPVPGWEVPDVETNQPQNPVIAADGPAPSESGAGSVLSPSTRGTRGIVYYSDGRAEPGILDSARAQLLRSGFGIPIVSVTQEPLAFGRNVVVPLRRGILTMFKQILAGLEASETDFVFFCEHDVLYHPSHFEFVPPRDDAPYYNVNCWKVDSETGRALFYVAKQTSGLCGSRQMLIEHYRKRIARVEQNARDIVAAGLPVKRDGYDRAMGFEPGSHRRRRAAVDDLVAQEWRSPFPNIDIRHANNLTPSRWSQDEFRDKNTCLEWTEADEVPGWGRTKGRFSEFLKEVVP